MGHKLGEPHILYFFHYIVMPTYLIIRIPALTGNYPRDRGLLCYTVFNTDAMFFNTVINTLELMNE